jgi:hypothetical protein
MIPGSITRRAKREELKPEIWTVPVPNCSFVNGIHGSVPPAQVLWKKAPERVRAPFMTGGLAAGRHVLPLRRVGLFGSTISTGW